MPTLEAQRAFQEAFGVRIPKGPMSSAATLPPAVPAKGVLEKVKSAIVSVPAAAKSAVGVLSAEKAAEIESIQATRNPIKRAAKTAMLGAETVKDVGATIARAPVRLATQVVRNAATIPATLMGKDDGVAEEYTPDNAFAKFFLGEETLGKSGSLGTQAAEASSEFAIRKLDPTLADLPANDPRRLAAKIGIGAPIALFGGLLEGADAELPGVGTAGKKAAKAGIKKLAKEGAEEVAKKAGKEAVEAAGAKAVKAAAEEGAQALAKEAVQSSAKPAVKAAAKELPEEVGTFVNKLGVAIHPDDAKIMEAYIDNVRLKGPANPELSLDATRIAEGYGMRMPKTEAGLANEFDDVLSRMRTQAKFDTAQAKAAVPTQAYGAVAGITPETDEQGNLTGVGFDPKMALAGVAGISAAQSEGGKKILKQLADKFGSLAASRVPAEAIEKAAREGSLEAVERLAKQNSDEIAEALSKGIDPEDLAKPNTLSPIGDALESRRKAILGASDGVARPLPSSQLDSEAIPQGTPQKIPTRTDNRNPIHPGSASQNLPQQTGQTPNPSSSSPDIQANSGSSYNERIADNKVYYNIDRLDIADESKESMLKAIDTPEVADAVRKETGAVLSNADIEKLARESTASLSGNTSAEETKKAIIESLNTRRRVAADFEAGTKSGEDLIREWMKSKTYNTDVARQLQALRIKAGPRETGIIDEMLSNIYRAGFDPEVVAKASNGVDFKDYSQVVKWYRSFVKPTAGEMVDKLRYSSMLSSPLTHIVNISSNAQQSGIVAPTYKAVRGAVDAVRAAIDGKPRKFYAGEGLAHIQGYASSVGDAAKRFKDSVTGAAGIQGADIRNIPLYTSGPKKAVERVLDAPMRMLEASDQFFTALSEGGAKRSIAYRAAKGGKAKADEASREAAYFLFRGKDAAGEQGHLLNAIDFVANKISEARSHKNPILSTFAKFSLPFVKTPTEIVKQGIEFTPAGLGTLWGAKNKTEQLAKAITGSTVMGIGGAMLLGSGRMTWGEPVDAEQKAAFRDAGLQPYSVKIGDKWYSYSKVAPALAFNLAFLAAYDDARRNRTLGDSELDAVVKSTAKVWKFWSDQSFIKGMGDLLTATAGDEEKMTQYFANYGNQLIPFRALQGWMARIFDPVQRKVDPDGSLLEKQLQAIMTQIPGLSQYVPARTNKYGEEIPIQYPVVNALSPIRMSKEDETKAGYVRSREQYREKGKDYREENRAANAQIKSQTQKNAAKLESLKTAEEKQAFLSGLDDRQIDAVIELLDEKTKRKDAFAEEIRSYGVANGIRAKAIVDEMEIYPEGEARAEFLAGLSEQGVLSDEVLDQVIEEWNKRKNQEPTR